MIITPFGFTRDATRGIASRRCSSSRCIHTAVSITTSNCEPRVVSPVSRGRLSSTHSMQRRRMPHHRGQPQLVDGLGGDDPMSLCREPRRAPSGSGTDVEHLARRSGNQVHDLVVIVQEGDARLVLEERGGDFRVALRSARSFGGHSSSGS